MPLTDVRIRQAKPTEKVQKLADGGALFLVIKPNGTKLWWYRFKLGGKERTFSIGEYPTISLQEARVARDKAKALVKQGIDPTQQRQVEKIEQQLVGANTFRAVGDEWIRKMQPKWSLGHYEKVQRVMEKDVYPALGALPIRKVTAAHILQVLQTMEARGAESLALMVRQWCSQLFRYAAATQRADADPASLLRGAIIAPATEHARALAEEEIKSFWQRLGEFKGNRTTAIACALLLYLAPRTQELRQAEWTEFDLDDKALWDIPAGKMKMRRRHLVPLPRQAVQLLLELKTITGAGRWLLPNTRDPKDIMSRMTINRALVYMGLKGVTAHDFRATASTHLHEMGYRHEVVDRQLAHAPKDKVQAAYNHAQYLDERRVMMQAWADYLDTLRP